MRLCKDEILGVYFMYFFLMYRKVETKTKVDIEDKKKQLRQLVGNSYRYI